MRHFVFIFLLILNAGCLSKNKRWTTGETAAFLFKQGISAEMGTRHFFVDYYRETNPHDGYQKRIKDGANLIDEKKTLTVRWIWIQNQNSYENFARKVGQLSNSITDITISSVELHPDGLRRIFKNMRNLKELRIWNCKVDNDLLHAFRDTSSLSLLEFLHSNISIEDAENARLSSKFQIRIQIDGNGDWTRKPGQKKFQKNHDSNLLRIREKP